MGLHASGHILIRATRVASSEYRCVARHFLFFFFNNGGKNRDEILLEIRCFQWKGRRKGRAVSREKYHFLGRQRLKFQQLEKSCGKV